MTRPARIPIPDPNTPRARLTPRLLLSGALTSDSLVDALVRGDVVCIGFRKRGCARDRGETRRRRGCLGGVVRVTVAEEDRLGQTPCMRRRQARRGNSL